MNYGGNLNDVEISENKVKQFLEIVKPEIEKLTLEHIRKINWYEENENN